MADDEADDTTLSEEQQVQEDVKWLRSVEQIEHDQREREEEDLSFQDADGSWPDEIRNARGPVPAAGGMPEIAGRPTISVASLDEPISLVDAQERKAHLGVTVHALTEDANDETAEILTAIYRGIERDSNAQRQRSWAAQRATRAGRGAYRIDTIYDPEGGHPLDQKIVLNRILYQSSVFFDPTAQKEDWSDGLKAMEVVDMPWLVYKRKYKESSLATASASELDALNGEASDDWIKQNGESDDTRTIRVAKVWRVDITEIEQVLLDDNTVSDADDIPEGRTKHPTDKRPVPKREIRKVFSRVINCKEILEQDSEHNGQYIPLVPTIGRELQPVRGKRKWIGMICNAKGGVRMTNYAASGAIEMASLEPLAPFQLDPKQIEGYEPFWKTANIRRWSYLPSHAEKDGIRFEKPQRTQVDASRMGPSMQLLSMGRDFVRTATGLHAPALGENTPAHRSGRAIANLQDQSIEGTSVYLDNLATVSMPYEALVILDLIPRIYDRPGRLARICDENYENSQLIMVNAPHLPAQKGQRPQPLPYGTPAEQQQTDAQVANPDHPAKHYDLNKGRYGVSVQIGKARPTRLAEGNDALSQLMQSDPALVPVLGPEWARFQDFPGAKQVADLLKKMRDHAMPWLSDDPQQTDPGRLMAENQTLKQQLAEASKIIEQKQIEAIAKYKTAEMQESAESQRAAADREVKLAVAEIQAKVDRMELFLEERARLGVQAHEVAQASLDRSHEAAQADQARAHELASGSVEHQQNLQVGTQDATNQAALAEQAQQHALETQANEPGPTE